MAPETLTTDTDVSPGGAQAGTTAVPAPGLVEDALIEEELLVEEVSIDGMCGVY